MAMKLAILISGWLFIFTSFNAVMGASNCNYQKLKVKLEKVFDTANGKLKIATLQVTKKNQDPVIAFFQDNRQVFCRADYDTTPVDARATTAILFEDHAFIAFSTDGGSNQKTSFARFTKKGWQKSYGKGGGPKASVILKIDLKNGNVLAGTYLTARKKDGKTNSLSVEAIKKSGNNLLIEAKSWYSPLKTNGKPFNCAGKSPFDYSVEIDYDLNKAISATAKNCK
ncbi:MAG: hypothetical protein KDK41_00055 [Leptospiraceae bacterium]|nr:hypothetical protein [Leptospiraceae bacterium]